MLLAFAALFLQDAPPPAPLPPTWLERFQLGWEAYERGELDQAERAWLKSREFAPRNATTAYHLACLEARRGRDTAALAWLAKAVEWGYADRVMLEWDADLAALRANPGFVPLLAAVDAVAALGYGAGVRADRLSIDWPRDEELLAQSRDGTRVVRARGGTPALEDGPTGEWIADLATPGEVVRHAIFSPDGTRVLTKASGTKLRLWDAVEGTLAAELECGTLLFDAPVFGAGSPRCVVPGSFWTAPTSVFDASTGELVSRVDWPCEELAVVSDDGERVFSLSASDDHQPRARLWHARDGELVASFALPEPRGPRARWRASFGAGGDWLAIWGAGLGDVRLVDARTGALACQLSISGDELLSLCALPGSARFACLAADEGLVWIDAAAGTWRAAEPRLSARAGEVQSSRDGATLLFTEPEELRLVRVEDGALLERWRAFPQAGARRWGPVRAHLGGGTLAALRTAGFDLGRDAQHVVLAREEALSNRLLAASSDGSEIALAVGSGELRLIEVESGRERLRLPVEGCTACAYSPSGALLALGGRSCITLHDRASGSELVRFELPLLDDGPDGPGAIELAFQPGGELLLAFGPSLPPTLWGLRSGERRAVFGQGERAGRWAAWSPDGKRLATLEQERCASLWSPYAPDEPALEFRAPAAIELVGFSPDGALLVLGCTDGRARVWDIARREQQLELWHAPLADEPAAPVRWAEYDRSGARLATVRGGELDVWNARTGQHQYGLELGRPAAGRVRARFDDDGRRLATWGLGEPAGTLSDLERRVPVLPRGTRPLDTVWPLPGGHALLLHGDGLRLAEGGGLGTRFQRIDLPVGALLRASSGWFAGDPAAIRRLELGGDSEAMCAGRPGREPLDACASLCFDPKRVRAAIAGVALRPPLLPPLPRCRLASGRARVLRVAGREAALELDGEGLLGFLVAAGGTQRFVRADPASPRTRIGIEAAADGAPQDAVLRALAPSGVLGPPRRLRLEFAPPPER